MVPILNAGGLQAPQRWTVYNPYDGYGLQVDVFGDDHHKLSPVNILIVSPSYGDGKGLGMVSADQGGGQSFTAYLVNSLQKLSTAPLHVVVYNPRYAQGPGTFALDLEAEVADLAAIGAALKEEYPQAKFHLLGWSLGAAVSVRALPFLQGHVQIKNIFLDSPGLPLQDMVVTGIAENLGVFLRGAEKFEARRDPLMQRIVRWLMPSINFSLWLRTGHTSSIDVVEELQYAVDQGMPLPQMWVAVPANDLGDPDIYLPLLERAWGDSMTVQYFSAVQGYDHWTEEKNGHKWWEIMGGDGTQPPTIPPTNVGDHISPFREHGHPWVGSIADKINQ